MIRRLSLPLAALTLTLAGCSSSPPAGTSVWGPRDERLLAVRTVRVVWRCDAGAGPPDRFAEDVAKEVAARLAREGFRSFALANGNAERARPVEVVEVARSPGGQEQDLMGPGDPKKLGRADAYLLLRVMGREDDLEVWGHAYTPRSPDRDRVVEDELNHIHGIRLPQEPAAHEETAAKVTSLFFSD